MQKGLEYHPENVYENTFEYEQVLQFAEERMKEADRPTSFLVATDQMAIAVMDAVARKDLRVPEDVSIVGFDNIDLAANPLISLTTVSQQKKKMALLAVEKLIGLIESGGKGAQPIQVTLEPELIIRKTSGPVPHAT